jgi:hypothetical protein
LLLGLLLHQLQSCAAPSAANLAPFSPSLPAAAAAALGAAVVILVVLCQLQPSLLLAAAAAAIAVHQQLLHSQVAPVATE